MEGAGLPRRAGGRADPRPRGPEHGRRAGAGSDHRHDGVQPVEHHRRVPAARQPEPGPQGGLRCRVGAAARLPLADPAAAPERGARRGDPRNVCPRQPVRAVVPAPGPPRPAQRRGLPVRAAGAEPVRQRAPGGPAGRQAGAARPARRAGPGHEDVRRDQQRPVRARDGRGRIGVRPEPAAGFPAGAVRRAQPDRRQPAAAAPRAVPAGPLAEPARRVVDPVPGARLGQPRPLPARPGRRPGAAAGGHAVVEHPGRPAGARDADRREHPVPRPAAQPDEPRVR